MADFLRTAHRGGPGRVLSLTKGVVKTMIVTWKRAAVTVAACVGLTGVGAWHGPVPVSARPADTPEQKPAVQPPKDAAPPAAAPKPGEPVATIFGDVPISREAFADHLIRRYGKQELELFVSNQIVAHAFAQKGLTITPAEIEAMLDATCARRKMTREQLSKELLERQGKTLEEWNEDMMIPTEMLARLCRAKVTAPTEAELRQAFDLRYGEKLDCRIIIWSKEDEARAAYEKVRGSEKEFDAHARRCPQSGKPNSGVAADGRAKPIPRARPFKEHSAEQAVHAAIAKLQPGEVSALTPFEFQGDRGFIVLKCDRVIPADTTKSFEKEKPTLLTDVRNAKAGNEFTKFSAELMREANPKYHLTFPNPVPRAAPPLKK
ncbi:peptidylprolyl isomerase [Frigoriglobus tundricola]|uniref:peptidylprolyl isomerase n=1 Tax=Frigoriglobus tundricola TaxID=2774151 RepID=A0A6M5Z0U0_9BACT|nr:peptidylprolyl isomerase [Frigoriglobus tundricola]QJW98822.1 hypothetical protein FTUN_6417 [Frigoriglobus tundricola]